MEVRRYIELINGINASVEHVVIILKESGATESEAVLALMVTRDISMDEAQGYITSSRLFFSPTRKSAGPSEGTGTGSKNASAKASF